MLDLRIRNALIADGTGQPAYVGDIAVQSGRIVAIGPVGSKTSVVFTQELGPGPFGCGVDGCAGE